MKPLFEKIPFNERSSFLVRSFQAPFIDAPWHFHPEYEIVYIQKGYGKRFVGDNIANFSEGDLLLLGSDLPHFWKCDKDFQNNIDLNAAWFVIQFQQIWLDTLKRSPEMTKIVDLLHKSQRGICFSNDFTKQISSKLLEVGTYPEASQNLIAFLGILEAMTHDKEISLLATDGYLISPNDTENERMKRILEYILENFQGEIKLDIIANIAHLTPPAFCRYFKQRTRKSFVDYLNEIRISHARKLLIDNTLSVAQIGLECGFHNLSHFHRQFKNLTGLSPMKYQKEYESK